MVLQELSLAAHRRGEQKLEMSRTIWLLFLWKTMHSTVCNNTSYKRCNCYHANCSLVLISRSPAWKLFIWWSPKGLGSEVQRTTFDVTFPKSSRNPPYTDSWGLVLPWTKNTGELQVACPVWYSAHFWEFWAFFDRIRNITVGQY